MEMGGGLTVGQAVLDFPLGCLNYSVPMKVLLESKIKSITFNSAFITGLTDWFAVGIRLTFFTSPLLIEFISNTLNRYIFFSSNRRLYFQ